MNRRGKIIVSVTGIFIVLLVLVGLTYAYFLTRITGNSNSTSISVTTADLKIVYTDGDSDGDGIADALIIADKIMPNTTITSKKFNVTNQGNAKSTYSIVLDKIENEFERNQDLVYTLTRNGVDEPVSEGHLVVGTKQIILPSVEIEKDETHTYALTIKYIEAGVDQSIDMNKTLNLRVNIENETVTWDTAKEGTLLYALKTNQPTGTEETIPGENASSINEARIIEVEDDYGTSYVYRGNVTNNYVTYSGMCWRIVRVQGDGTIKLVLADENYECGEDAAVAEDGTYLGYNKKNASSALIMNELLGMYSFYGEDNWGLEEIDILGLRYDQSYVWGFLYEWADRKVQRKLEDGTLKEVINLDTSKLAETEWCNDLSISSVRGWGYDEFGWETNVKEDAISWQEDIFYTGGHKLTLKCNNQGLKNSKALRIVDNIGILSADEIIYAGATYTSSNYTHYLLTNAGSAYWTMTPGAITVRRFEPTVIIVDSTGQLSSNICYYDSNVRPAITLLANCKIKSGNGTQSNPYVVE